MGIEPYDGETRFLGHQMSRVRATLCVTESASGVVNRYSGVYTEEKLFMNVVSITVLSLSMAYGDGMR
ncbi:MAG: hypothetical protein KatS3mg113_0740 [Planctomycetaceae bacterium]|nr:MAG: hypothetical protein KatS3mg113_0740 [Planctomycetaceae bacterium]